MAKWTIRPAQNTDAGALAACIDAAYAEARDRVSGLPDVSAGVSDDISENLVWVVEIDNAIKGGLILILKADHAVLANVAVDPECSGMGIGRGLINHAEDECRRRGLMALRLSTHVDMPENVALYEHLGWRVSARSSNKVQMSKCL